MKLQFARCVYYWKIVEFGNWKKNDGNGESRIRKPLWRLCKYNISVVTIPVQIFVDLVVGIDGRLQEIVESKERSEDRLTGVEEQYSSNAYSIKQFFNQIDMKELTEELVNTFISKIKVYKDKRIEIEWSFSFPEL